ncbi:hypothetical protein MAPG_08578 [Magnaporthiopsis poae ATCC 64411]|uniref:Uncharacterized protein n=1 Tax=Magnaporthiopsis poae (strain ATCC 64411 / 73-15) TaxID=644358 RepID=A0A0C4E7Q8_MAGP6|nr:hypothetical protein MAPG_08578 [Magnaporthiopsis poae ATCC 64411]
MNVQLPPIDYAMMPEWRWPSAKFGIDMTTLFTDIYREYNMEPSPIQQAEAFHHDVYEIAKRASTKEEFYRLLGERKEQRLEELREAFGSVVGELIGRPSLTKDEDLWASITRFAHYRTLDHLVQHFAYFIPEGHFEERQRNLDRNSARIAKLLRKPFRGIDADGNRVDGTDPYEKPDLTHLPLSSLPPMPSQSSRGPKEHHEPERRRTNIPSPPRSSPGAADQSPEPQVPITPPPRSPRSPPRSAVRMTDSGTQTLEGRVTKRKPAAPRRTGVAAAPRRRSVRVAAQAEESLGGGRSRYNLRSKQGAGTAGRARERRGAATRGRR